MSGKNKPLSKKKIAVIGASYNFSTGLMSDLMQNPAWDKSEVHIYDIRKEPVETVVAAGTSLKKAYKSGLKIVGASSRKEAIKDADFVMVCILVGGREQCMKDLAVCKKFNVGHSIGDTAGPGALIRSLRSVPVVIDLAKDIKKYCPRAWVINFTNPMAVFTGAFHAAGHDRTIGLCHGGPECERHIADAYGIKEKDVKLEYAGINHFAFVTDAKIKGKKFDLEKIYDRLSDYEGEGDRHTGYHESYTFTSKIAKIIGLMSNNPDRHTLEFYPRFYGPREQFGKKYKLEIADYPERMRRNEKGRQHLLDIAKDAAIYKHFKQPSGEAAEQIMFSILMDKKELHAVNIPNKGAIHGVPDNTIVEIKAHVGRNGIKRRRTVKLPDHIENTVARHGILNNMYLEAGISGDKKTALASLFLDPMVADFNTLEAFLDELLKVNKSWLPQFFKRKK
jgi:alpha-galactosidase